MDPLWSEIYWSTFKYRIILIVSLNYILCTSWIIKCLLVNDARCKLEDICRCAFLCNDVALIRPFIVETRWRVVMCGFTQFVCECWFIGMTASTMRGMNYMKLLYWSVLRVSHPAFCGFVSVVWYIYARAVVAKALEVWRHARCVCRDVWISYFMFRFRLQQTPLYM